MKTLRDINTLIIEENDKKKFLESNNEKNINDAGNPDSFSAHLQNKAAPPIAKRKNYLVKRLSPFLLMAALLVVLFSYMFITGTGNIESIWLKIILFPGILVNVLFADFAIWNYFEGKKRFQIWIIELIVSSVIIYLLL